MSSAATATQFGASGTLADAIAPKPLRFDPLGFVSGFEAYQIYTALAAKTDGELAALGLGRADLANAAMTAVRDRSR